VPSSLASLLSSQSCVVLFFAAQRNAKEQEELAQERKSLAEAITELQHIEEEKHARYFSFVPSVHFIADQYFKRVSRLLLIFRQLSEHWVGFLLFREAPLNSSPVTLQLLLNR